MFIPLYDLNRLHHVLRPYVTWSLITLNVLAFVLLQGAGLGQVIQASAFSYGLVPSVLFDQKDLPAHLQMFPSAFSLVSYSFMHGGWLHLGGNLLFLWVFGDNVEDDLGHFRFVIFYLLCSAAGGLAYAITNFGSDVPLVGASGAVSGVIVGYLILHPDVKVWVLFLGRIPLRLSARWLLGGWVIYQVFHALVAGADEIAWSAHIGGMLAGALLIFVMRRRPARR
ncbi:MAG: rhomboid family intramembrane serine protease [Rhodobacteraceae bacterium]|nr:rhomboid family intramembrane serine protease [Paracoccaceae bacterium]